MSDWRLIPSQVDETGAPFDGDDVLIYREWATVDIVRLVYWVDGSEGMERGWWSAHTSVNQECMNWLEPTHWAPFESPLQK